MVLKAARETRSVCPRGQNNDEDGNKNSTPIPMTARQRRKHKAGNLLRFAFACKVLTLTPLGWKLDTTTQTGRALLPRFNRYRSTFAILTT